MGHHARTLTAICAVITLSAAAAPSAHAVTGALRIETPRYRDSFDTTFVNRTSVPVGATPVIKAGQSCAPDSPAAAISAVVGDVNWDGAWDGSALTATKIRGLAPESSSPTWTWTAYVDENPVTDLCQTHVPNGSETLLFPHCLNPATTTSPNCFAGEPLYLQLLPYPWSQVDPITVPASRAPVSVRVFENHGPSNDSTVNTDEGPPVTTADPHGEGVAVLAFTQPGPHTILATEAGKVPARLLVCATNGGDGYCGTTKEAFNPFDVNATPSPCTTNGRDGFCGTDDTTGPVTHVTNIAHKQKFKKKKGPGLVKGTIELDPNRVGAVKLRLTRVTTSRVLIKPKKKSAKAKKTKKRYRTVKRCTTWDNGTALLETAKCGTKYGKWFDADLTDLRDAFSYDFAMKLPAGAYTLEVVATDENGFKDPPAAGRNVLTFTVL
jgi:hypothetical protein